MPGEYTAREANELKNLIAKAVAYAHQKGALVITSAGNEGINGDKDKNLIHLPSDAPHAMSVSATAPIGWALDPNGTFLDNLASYSNYGRSVISVAAPGGDAAYPGNENCTLGRLVRPCYVFDLVLDRRRGWSQRLLLLERRHEHGHAACLGGRCLGRQPLWTHAPGSVALSAGAGRR